jgi:hypothetical protein
MLRPENQFLKHNPEWVEKQRQLVVEQAIERGAYWQVQGEQKVLVFQDEHVEQIKEEKKKDDLMLKKVVEKMCHDVWVAVQADREFKHLGDKSKPQTQPLPQK